MCEDISLHMNEVGINFQYGFKRHGLLLDVILTSFLILCVFDPANIILTGKTWVFITLFLYSFFLSRIYYQIPKIIFLYVAFFVGIPLFSIAIYFTYGGSPQFEGFNLLKGYLLITLSIILIRLRVNILPRLCLILSLMGLLVIIVTIAFDLYPESQLIIRELGKKTGTLVYDERNYGNDLVIEQMYFVTSPMLLISMAYYFLRLKLNSESLIVRIKTGLMVLINILALFAGGTRANILSTLILLITLWTITSNDKRRDYSILAIVLLTSSTYFINDLVNFFDVSEYSNNIKLDLVSDYFRIMSDLKTFFLGQGLGSTTYWSARGYEFYTSELTYLEIFRNFGFPGGIVILSLLSFPLYKYLQKKDIIYRGLGSAYLVFLILCFFNPNLFNSMGVTIISMMLANLYIPRGHIL